ncbi:curli biogenesis system outer membrane secretion channel CsgG [Litorivivens lipolytica]|uniref:Curli biogenesis system outer membrane secretion channel CsgG n=1 Tax=Litorivivens lipolytica TaxID=1524264 RepID=A0A7W4Z8C6_9GAMM|nr:CsgG/HfaB family protein [Litorivivens lipolytica]MBB3048875.1 curli biogenesis system outer membrane secretion channel CsgG [Litorivivens lipolytica]
MFAASNSQSPKRWLTSLVGLGCLVVSLAANAAGTQQVEVRAKGFGSSESEAVREGLSAAVAQVNGTTLKSSQSTRTHSVTAAASNEKGEREEVDMEMTSEQSAATQTSGEIHSYEILSMERVDKGYAAELLVRVYRYDAPVSSSRSRMALLKTDHNRSRYDIFGVYSGHDLAGRVNSALERELVQYRKFAVLSRQELDHIGNELALITSDATSREEKAKAGRMLGADYLLISEITGADGRTWSETTQVTGQTKHYRKGTFSIGLKVIAAATGEIKFSEKYSGYTTKGNVDSLIAYVAKKAIADTVERIFPKRIVKVSGDSLVINAGGRSISVGDHYDAFTVGEPIIDPYTGESLGGEESYVGTIKVTEVHPKLAYAKPASKGSFTEGMILRAAKTAPKKKSRPKAEQPRATTGVRLPFD